MGMCQSQSQEEKVERERNKQIEHQLSKDRKKMRAEVKILLLGAGESGKSTIVKQMRIIHLEGFSEEERLSFKEIIYFNVLKQMRALVVACQKLEIKLSGDNEPLLQKWSDLRLVFHQTHLTEELAEDVKKLWVDDGIQEAFARSSEYQLNDSAKYFFDHMERIAVPDYVPNEQDVLRVRAKTTGIVETEFDVKNVHFRLVDVGGQRNERKKWIHCFQDVTAIIFCVSMSEYDMVLEEDETQNRMLESLRLFDDIVNNMWFRNTSVILFLNKIDLFEVKIKKVDLKVCFPEYDQGLDYDAASSFIEAKFVEVNKSQKSRYIYTHYTCATDTGNIRVVIGAVQVRYTHSSYISFHFLFHFLFFILFYFRTFSLLHHWTNLDLVVVRINFSFVNYNNNNLNNDQ